MSTHISVKSVPDVLMAALRERAARNHRSLQGEIMSILEAAVASRPAHDAHTAHSAQPAPERITIDALATRAQALFPHGTSSSVELLRDARDGRNR
jgi:plasmid stability protein